MFPFGDVIMRTTWVFHCTWQVPKISLRDVVYSLMLFPWWLICGIISVGNQMTALHRWCGVGPWFPTQIKPQDKECSFHYNDVIMCAMASLIIGLTVVYSTVYSGADQRKHQSSTSLAFVRGIHRWPMNSPHNWPVTRKMFPFDDVIMSPRKLIGGTGHV